CPPQPAELRPGTTARLYDIRAARAPRWHGPCDQGRRRRARRALRRQDHRVSISSDRVWLFWPRAMESSMPDAPKPPPVDLQQAALEPGSVFDSPESPLSHVGLSARQKAEILRRWQYDAAEIGVATEEG